MKTRIAAATIVVAQAVTACNSTAAVPSTTVILAPPTSAAAPPTTSTPEPTTVSPTTSAPPTTAAATAPPAATVEDQLLEAINRAQTAMRNCYSAAPDPCDQTELENAFVGIQLDVVMADAQEATNIGFHAEQLDELQWTVLEGPALQGDELGIATVCRSDASIAVLADGSVLNDEAVRYLQTWHLLPVGQTWKLGETINVQRVPMSEGNPCE